MFNPSPPSDPRCIGCQIKASDGHVAAVVAFSPTQGAQVVFTNQLTHRDPHAVVAAHLLTAGASQLGFSPTSDAFGEYVASILAMCRALGSPQAREVMSSDGTRTPEPASVVLGPIDPSRGPTSGKPN